MSDQMKAEFAAKIAASVATGLVPWVVVPLGALWRECLPDDNTSSIVSVGVPMETPGCEGCIAYTVWGKTANDIEFVLRVIEEPEVPVASMLF